MDYVIAIASLALGALLGVRTTHHVVRAKLRVGGRGGGGGQGPGFHRNYVGIRNEPSMIGLRLGETIIFGKLILPRIERGMVVARNAAHECTAQLRDENGEHVAVLWWAVDEGSAQRYRRTVTIGNGETANLMLFARLHDERFKYFPFQPDNAGNPVVPHDEMKFTDSKNFRVRVDYSSGRHLDFGLTMTKRDDGRLYYSTRSGGGSF